MRCGAVPRAQGPTGAAGPEQGGASAALPRSPMLSQSGERQEAYRPLPRPLAAGLAFSVMEGAVSPGRLFTGPAEHKVPTAG